jgi:acetyl esterase
MDPELAAVLEVLPAVDFSDIAAERSRFAALMAIAPPMDFGDVDVTERTIPGPDGAPEVPVRILSVRGAANGRPGVLDIHGGGTSIGVPAMDDGINAAIASELGAVVVSVDYRLSPEHPYPAPMEDCYAALLWFVDHAAELGVDPARIAVIGDSAGGNLATVTALLARDRGGPAIAMQALLEPMLDDRLETNSMITVGQDSYVWNLANATDAWRYYLNGQEPTAYAAPARMEDLSGLPPTYLTVNELDPLRDEGLQYAQRLLAAGVSTELHCWPQACHGFGLIPTAAVTQRAAQALVGALGRGLGVAV